MAIKNKPECHIRSDGTKIWHLNNKFHRIDGPAVEAVNGSTEWFHNGKLHRTDGPAIEGPNGRKQWWICGYNYLTFEDFIKELRLPDEERMYMMLKYG